MGRFRGCFVLLVCTLGVAVPVGSAAEELRYDVYRWGILSHTLSIADGDRYTLRIRDLANDRWSEPLVASADAIAAAEDFRLTGAIAEFPVQYASLADTEWGDNLAVAWPDARQIYVRHRELTAEVNGSEVTAWHWAARGASNPMDLVIGGNGGIVAAMDVAGDHVVVRRGFASSTIRTTTYSATTSIGRRYFPATFGTWCVTRSVSPPSPTPSKPVIVSAWPS